jgi:hypothetical protein
VFVGSKGGVLCKGCCVDSCDAPKTLDGGESANISHSPLKGVVFNIEGGVQIFNPAESIPQS